MGSFLEEIDLVHQIDYLLNGDTRLIQNKIIAHRKYKWQAYEYFMSEVSSVKGMWKRIWGYDFVWDGLFVEVNYKQCLYKCGLKEKWKKIHI